MLDEIVVDGSDVNPAFDDANTETNSAFESDRPSGITDTRVVSDADPEVVKPGEQYAQVDDRQASGRPVDLLEERELGGHTVERHAGRSPESLYNAVKGSIDFARRRGEPATDMTQSSFTSLEAANKLVNATISQNSDKVDLVVKGFAPRATLEADFSSPTGKAAYARNERSQTMIADTYGVRVIIVADKTTSRGFRVDTAFPIISR